jgi:cytochrome P450
MHLAVDGRPLTNAEIVSILRNWTAGDLGSIAAAIGVIVHFIATHPEVQTNLRDGVSDPAAAVDEMLRIDDPFLVNRRVTTVAKQVAGFDLAPGTRVYLNWASANRDEAVFSDPDAYRPEEHAAHNLVYGVGIHACPGRPLATLELVAILRALLQETSRVELASDSQPVRETYPLGGWRRVPVRLS